MSLEELIERAQRRLAAPGIEGWGLTTYGVVTLVGGEVVDTGPAQGCTNDQCSHFSHDPAAPRRRWIPPAGVTVLELGSQPTYGGHEVFFLARSRKGQDVFLRYHREPHYHAELEVVDSVPDWALTNLVKVGEDPEVER